MKCKICKKQFIPNRYVSNWQLYCSKYCSKIAYYRRNRKTILEKCKRCYKEKRAKLVKLSKRCDYCGLIFQTWRITQRFCSGKCLKNDWGDRHRDYMKKAIKKWQDSDAGKKSRERRKERILHNASIQQDRRRGAKGSHTLQEWNELKRKYNFSCVCCKRKIKLTKDHIIPIIKGGTNFIDNIQPFCMDCNLSKNSNSQCQIKHSNTCND